MMNFKIISDNFTIFDSQNINKSHLSLPIQKNNFLISPPPSPPIGWEQIYEDPPVSSEFSIPIDNFELVSKLCGFSLKPGESAVVIDSINQNPSIVIDNVEFDINQVDFNKKQNSIYTTMPTSKFENNF